MRYAEIIGNVRTGTKSEKDNPVQLNYFDVHQDNSTSMVAVEIFNETFNKPTELIIQPYGTEPLQIFYERYGGKRVKCYGNNKEAIQFDDKGNKTKRECNSNCKYRLEKTCKRRARFYFKIKGIEDEGIWCYPMGSEKGISNIEKYLNYMKRKNININEQWFKIFLQTKYGVSGKNYIPDIQRINICNSIRSDNDKYLLYMGRKDGKHSRRKGAAIKI